MVKIKIIESGKINAEGIKKVGTGFLIGLSGYIVAELAQLPSKIDFGPYQSLAVVVSGVLVNCLRKVMLPYEAK